MGNKSSVSKGIKDNTPKTSTKSSIPSISDKKTNINNMIEFDLSIFKDETDECTDFVKCTVIRRLFASLKYYAMLDITNNVKQQDVFADFINKVYSQQLLSDYTHLITEHSQDLEGIHASIINNKMFGECNIKRCLFTSRHQSERDIDGKKKHTLDPVLSFYKETMDSLHFYLFHCFDAGLRTKKPDNNNDEEEAKGDRYFDAEFNRIHRIVSEKRDITKRFNRFKTNNAKFSIITAPDNNDDDGNSTTFLDEIYKYLSAVGVKKNAIKNLRYFVSDEQYETESIEYDVLNGHDDENNNGNIEQYVSTKHCIVSIKEFIKASKISSSSFSIGLRFYYWDYYKSLKELPDDEQDPLTNIDHSGYEIADLYISPKYGSFKEEIANYKDIDFKQYEEEIKVKAKSYQNTPIVEATKAAVGWGTANEALHYGIPGSAVLGFPNLVSLIMYTDYTALSSTFSSTFRKKSPFETLKSIKTRNADYYWFSKTLRETVEIFGQCSLGDYDTKSRKAVNQLLGSFYCGMSFVMNMPEINIFLCSPTSTSKQIEVGIKFSGDEGIVIQLDNPEIRQYCFLRGFNCSWISRYKEEDERLFFGGHRRIKIESIRIRNTKQIWQNYETFIFSLFYLDSLLTGAEISRQDTWKISDDDVIIISNLLNNILGKPTTETFDEYIYSTFQCFCQHKKQIILDLFQLDRYADKRMTDLIMNSLDKRDPYKEKKRDNGDLSNMFHKELLGIFKNIKSLIIITTSSRGVASYSLSLLSLIDSISFLDKVIIKAVSYGWSNWIYSLWSSSSETIKREYDAKGYTISMKEIRGRQEYWFMINKKN